MNFVNGMEASSHPVDPTWITIGRGECSSEGGGITISMGFVKHLGLPWAAGANAGLLDQGSLAANTTYHLFAIGETGDDEGDFLASTSPLNPLMPSGFHRKRRIGSLVTNASAQIMPFQQIGGWFYFLTPRMAWGGEPVNTTAKTLVTGCPVGVKVMIEMFVQVCGNSTDGYLCLSDPDLGNAEIFDAAISYNTGLTGRGASVVRIWTDTLGKISAYANTSATLQNSFLRGWFDLRDGNEVHDAGV